MVQLFTIHELGSLPDPDLQKLWEDGWKCPHCHLPTLTNLELEIEREALGEELIHRRLAELGTIEMMPVLIPVVVDASIWTYHPETDEWIWTHKHLKPGRPEDLIEFGFAAHHALMTGSYGPEGCVGNDLDLGGWERLIADWWLMRGAQPLDLDKLISTGQLPWE